MAGPLIARPGQGTSPWDAIKLGAELPGPGGVAAAGDPKLAMGALEELVAALRAGKAVNPKELPRLLQGIAKALGRRARGQKDFTQVPDVLASKPLDSTLQGVLKHNGGAPFPAAPPRPIPPVGGSLAQAVQGGKAATHPGLGSWIAGILGGGAAGYGLSQLGGGEESPAGLPPGAELLMPSHASTRPARPSGARPRRPGMPSLPGVSDGLPEGLGEMFAAPTDEESRMPEQELSGRNPAMGMDTFFPDGQMNSVRDALGFTGNQQMAPRKKNFLQAILGKLQEEL